MYVDKDGKKTPIRGKVGDNAMYLAHRYGIEIEGMCNNYIGHMFFQGLALCLVF